MSALPVPSQFSPSDARSLTDEVKNDAAALWAKLLALYEGGAHTALGYSSWGAYYEAEFGESGTHGYRLLDSARVVDAIGSPMGERVARELAPVLREAPERVAEVWADVVAEHGPSPTAVQVREHVEPRRPGRMDVHYSSATDEWATPQDFYDLINAEFGFQTDVCALPSSAKCTRFYAPDDDGLAQTWTGTCWMNPPYGGEIREWVAKAHESAMVHGATVVCLVPARVDTGWWWDHCRHGEIRFLRGRLKFGNSDTSAPFPSALVVFSPSVAPSVVWWER